MVATTTKLLITLKIVPDRPFRKDCPRQNGQWGSTGVSGD